MGLICPALLFFLLASMLLPAICFAQDLYIQNTNQVARFIGYASCSSSSCHGGAQSNRNHVLFWERLDHHSATFATLNRRRSQTILEQWAALHSTVDPKTPPTVQKGCTVCHDPIQHVPTNMLAGHIKAQAGVSCESCHGPAENYVRSHWRPLTNGYTNLLTGEVTDAWTYEDRLGDGLRNLKNLYTRANTCVACHQNLDPKLYDAGHPELLFELDGQSADQPPHWRREPFRGQTWLVGQAVAMREMSSMLQTNAAAQAQITNRWRALNWLLKTAAAADPALAYAPAGSAEHLEEAAAHAKKAADELARRVAETKWSSALSRSLVKTLSDPAILDQGQALPSELPRRAEALTLALDRLSLDLVSTNSRPVNAALTNLFGQIQIPRNFQAANYTAALRQFQQAIDGSSAQASR